MDLRARDFGFRSPTEGIDTTTPGGRFVLVVLVVLAGLAEMERVSARSPAWPPRQPAAVAAADPYG